MRKTNLICVMLLSCVTLFANDSTTDSSYIYFSGGVDAQATAPSFGMELRDGKHKWESDYFLLQPLYGSSISVSQTLSFYAGAAGSVISSQGLFSSLFAAPSYDVNLDNPSIGQAPMGIRYGLELGYTPPGKTRFGVQLFQQSKLSGFASDVTNLSNLEVAAFLAIPFGSGDTPALIADMELPRWDF